MSPLAQGRGLKYYHDVPYQLGMESPLAQGRGLKYPHSHFLGRRSKVAPRAGAWIEISTISSIVKELAGRPSRRGVD